MINLEQIAENNKLVMGWYGSCDNEPCIDFPLKTQDVYDVIDSVYEISTDSSKPRVFSSFLASQNSAFVQSLESLECGHSYWFTLKPGVVGDLKSLPNLNLSVTGENIDDAGRVTDDCDSGGGGGVSNIMFLNGSPSDNGDLRISIGADLTEINSLCTSNVWAYRIEKLANQTDETGTQVQGITFAPGDQNSVTVLSNYISSTDGGASWYKVYIQGYAADQTTAVTDEISEKLFIGWPPPTFSVNDIPCWGPGSGGFINNDDASVLMPNGGQLYEVIPYVCGEIGGAGYLEHENPHAIGAAWRFNSFLIADVSILTGSLVSLNDNVDTSDDDPTDPATINLNNWEYKLLTPAGDGAWHGDLTELESIFDLSVVNHSGNSFNVRLKEGLAPATYRVYLQFTYVGNDGSTWHTWVKQTSEVKDRTIEITNAVDNDEMGISLTVSRTNVQKWHHRVLGPNGAELYKSTSPSGSSTITTYVPLPQQGPGTYKVEVWGVSQINGVWEVVTPVVSEDVVMNWPSPTLNLSDSINEGYEEESGPSAGNNILTITHNWVTEYKISMPDNTDGAWEIKRDGEADAQYVTIPTTPTSYFTISNQVTNYPDISDVYILRLKAGLPANGNNGYDLDFILNGTARDGSTISQKSTLVEGQVSVKPPCCDGMPNGNTFETTGYGNNNTTPTVSASGIKVRTIGFESSGKLCFSNGTSGMVPDVYLVDLYDPAGVKLVGGAGASDPFGSVNVQGTFTGSKDVVYEDPLGNCYIGELSAISPARNELHDPGRNEGPTLFGTE